MTEDFEPAPALLRAMHLRGNEIQLARVVHAVCQQPDVAREFVAAVLTHRKPPIGQPKRAVKVPGDMRCRDEVRLTEDISLNRLRRRARELGRVDLLFAAPRFRLLLELKVDSGFGTEQIKRYSKDGGRVVAIVRDPDAALQAVGSDLGPGWLGACAWSEIVDALYALPVDEASAELWKGLLRTLQEAGDFAANAPGVGSLEVSAQVLDAVRKVIAPATHSRLAAKYGTGFATAIEWLPARANRRWATLRMAIDSTPVLVVALREAHTPAPTLEVEWYPPKTRALNAAHAKLLRSEARKWERSPNHRRYLTTTPVPERPGTGSTVARVTRELSSILDQLIRAGVLEWDAFR